MKRNFVGVAAWDRPLADRPRAPQARRVKEIPIGADPYGTDGTRTLYQLGDDIAVIHDSATQRVEMMPMSDALKTPWVPYKEAGQTP